MVIRFEAVKPGFRITHEMVARQPVIDAEKRLHLNERGEGILDQILAVDDENLTGRKHVEPPLHMHVVLADADGFVRGVDSSVGGQHLLLERRHPPRQRLGISGVPMLVFHFQLHVIADGALDGIAHDEDQLHVHAERLFNAEGSVGIDKIPGRLLDHYLIVRGQGHLFSIPVIAQVIIFVEIVDFFASGADGRMPINERQQRPRTAFPDADDHGVR